MTQPLDINAVSAHYGTTKVLEDLSLSVQAGELVSLLGASGCGKTTTLRLIAGFLSPTSGSITLGGRDLTRLPTHKRDIGLVFQNYALFPHLTVLENVAFGLKQRGIAPAERRKRALAMLERVGLAALADRAPGALSGGQKQRVALARALVIEPPLLMFDEPLSNLDAKLRVDMRVEIRQLQRANGTTSVYVTHDQEEAFSISDRVAIMNAGRLMQFDRPEVLYRRPANTFVARFVGFENIIPFKVTAREGDRVTAETAGMALRLPQSAYGTIPDTFLLATRPDGLVVSTDPAAEGLPATLGLRTYLGRAYQYQCETPAGHLIANGSLTAPLESGTAVKLVPAPEQCTILAAEGAR
ncbi:putative spermidine/putrescine transport system ATP-binding protein [Microvirga flocculans]|uniref:Putative spermidine/putrescine transport system ATP-binding protein n=1 Tax=Microvirga flocculans TaxID=217168 RepID=A0A7W6N8R9_9HYPH|nr:ABC transporter ATP-binding protein [Microvirga flocculans]MBB4041518.1 putative spermidine/putrescine transport system ATP-binding protein [Microvirga flocculans]